MQPSRVLRPFLWGLSSWGSLGFRVTVLYYTYSWTLKNHKSPIFKDSERALALLGRTAPAALCEPLLQDSPPHQLRPFGRGSWRQHARSGMSYILRIVRGSNPTKMMESYPVFCRV